MPKKQPRMACFLVRFPDARICATVLEFGTVSDFDFAIINCVQKILHRELPSAIISLSIA